MLNTIYINDSYIIIFDSEGNAYKLNKSNNFLYDLTNHINDSLLEEVFKNTLFKDFLNMHIVRFININDLKDLVNNPTSFDNIKDIYKNNNNKPEEKVPVIKIDDDTIVPYPRELEKYVNYFYLIPGSKVGFKNFIQRVSASIKDKQYSVLDLVKFLTTSNLPLANDGSLVGYKYLTKCSSDEIKDSYKDAYTKTIMQDIGSIVKMDPKLIDTNRNIECSIGLHVASKEYICGSVSSDEDVFLVRVQPEDIYAVPNADKSKIRVSKYKILSKLSDENKQQINNGECLKEHGFEELLTKAILGDDPETTEEINIYKDDGNRHPLYTVTKFSNKEEEPEKSTVDSNKNIVSIPEDVFNNIITTEEKGNNNYTAIENTEKVEKPDTTNLNEILKELKDLLTKAFIQYRKSKHIDDDIIIGLNKLHSYKLFKWKNLFFNEDIRNYVKNRVLELLKDSD